MKKFFEEEYRLEFFIEIPNLHESQNYEHTFSFFENLDIDQWRAKLYKKSKYHICKIGSCLRHKRIPD